MGQPAFDGSSVEGGAGPASQASRGAGFSYGCCLVGGRHQVVTQVDFQDIDVALTS